MTARALRMLYREVPAVDGCKPECGKCCGPVPWAPAEIARVAARIPPGTERLPAPGGPAGFVLLADPRTGMCAFLSAERACTVYDARPLMCRMFGAVDAPNMRCPFGAKARAPLRHDQGRSLVGRYRKELA